MKTMTENLKGVNTAIYSLDPLRYDHFPRYGHCFHSLTFEIEEVNK